MGEIFLKFFFPCWLVWWLMAFLHMTFQSPFSSPPLLALFEYFPQYEKYFWAPALLWLSVNPTYLASRSHSSSRFQLRCNDTWGGVGWLERKDGRWKKNRWVGGKNARRKSRKGCAKKKQKKNMQPKKCFYFFFVSTQGQRLWGEPMTPRSTAGVVGSILSHASNFSTLDCKKISKTPSVRVRYSNLQWLHLFLKHIFIGWTSTVPEYLNRQML